MNPPWLMRGALFAVFWMLTSSSNEERDILANLAVGCGIGQLAGFTFVAIKRHCH